MKSYTKTYTKRHATAVWKVWSMYTITNEKNSKKQNFSYALPRFVRWSLSGKLQFEAGWRGSQHWTSTQKRRTQNAAYRAILKSDCSMNFIVWRTFGGYQANGAYGSKIILETLEAMLENFRERERERETEFSVPWKSMLSTLIKWHIPSVRCNTPGFSGVHHSFEMKTAVLFWRC